MLGNVAQIILFGLPSIKFKKAVRFDPKDVENFIRDHRRRKGKGV